MLERLKKLMRSVNPDVNLDSVTLETKLVDDLHFDSILGVNLVSKNQFAEKIS